MGRKAKEKTDDLVRYTIRFQKEFWERMSVLAKKYGTSMAGFVRGSMMFFAAVSMYLDGDSDIVIRDRKTGKETAIVIVGFFMK